eukprot:c35848_g1_i1 orf=242-640(-)
MATPISTSIELKVPANKLWEELRAPKSALPKLIPDFIESSEIIEGEGDVGTIKLVKFGPALLPYQITFSKEKIVAVDDDRKTIKVCVIEGDMLNLFKSYEATITIVEGSQRNTSTVNLTVYREALDPDVALP